MSLTVRTGDGQELPVEVSGDGMFIARLDRTTQVSADTLAKLQKTVTSRTRDKDVSVTFTRITVSTRPGAPLYSARQGTARRLHAVQYNRVLVTWADDGKRDDFYAYQATTLGELTGEETEELSALIGAANDAAAQVDAFCAAHQIDLRATVAATAEDARRLAQQLAGQD